MIEVTHHAAQRYVERVNPALSLDEARREIMSHERAIMVAIQERCTCVRLGCGAKLVLVNGRVVDVRERRWILPPVMRPARLNFAMEN
ncbi:hypothetical protein [Stakelama pacifica]|uniref:DUF4258 domain-containing protein n=1 Tax=Stakelama pacifica TaxID=517720 RepID=A0A4V3BT26_9SPHN|nr:hypothetical protein [Stakelama pacifica]TDN81738.1 hypothetical protein EV664_107140 [Stakelama pacifica]GGO96418.1 hypothetical protein GCM10011329_22900 [Stakelama pacifica]